MNFEKIKTNLEKRGFVVSCFETAKDAALYLDKEIDNTSVAFGGSSTLSQIGLKEKLETHNTVYWHWVIPENIGKSAIFKNASETECYIASANGISENGEIVNIDGTGNRIASMAYGHQRLFFVVGKNKIEEDLDKAIYRARNIASPLNAKRLNRKTPCAVDGKCHDCSSPERICKGVLVSVMPMSGVRTEVVLVNEDLGF